MSIVWTKMLQADSAAAAGQAARAITDKRIKHFYDAKGRVGRAIAQSLGESGQVAWDIYLFYVGGNKWGEMLPRPDAWAHQLRGTWTDHYHAGPDLQAELASIAERLLAKKEQGS